MSTLVLVGPEGRIICERCELAGGLVSRMRDLSGRTPLSRRRGMLMRPTWIVHTAFMHFPVDVILLDRELTVLAVREHVQPWRTAGHLRAHSVLKLAARESAVLALRVGDRLSWRSLPRNSSSFTFS